MHRTSNPMVGGSNPPGGVPGGHGNPLEIAGICSVIVAQPIRFASGRFQALPSLAARFVAHPWPFAVLFSGRSSISPNGQRGQSRSSHLTHQLYAGYSRCADNHLPGRPGRRGSGGDSKNRRPTCQGYRTCDSQVRTTIRA